MFNQYCLEPNRHTTHTHTHIHTHHTHTRSNKDTNRWLCPNRECTCLQLMYISGITEVDVIKYRTPNSLIIITTSLLLSDFMCFNLQHTRTHAHTHTNTYIHIYIYIYIYIHIYIHMKNFVVFKKIHLWVLNYFYLTDG